MRKLAAGSIATSLVREEEGACLGAIAGRSVGELVSLGHDDFGVRWIDGRRKSEK